jgi:hypothetical protein
LQQPGVIYNPGARLKKPFRKSYPGAVPIQISGWCYFPNPKPGFTRKTYTPAAVQQMFYKPRKQDYER